MRSVLFMLILTFAVVVSAGEAVKLIGVNVSASAR